MATQFSLLGLDKQTATRTLVQSFNEQAVTTSLKVAEVFQRPHKDVLSSIRGLDCSSTLRERNFSLSCYVVKNGNVSKRNPMYYIGKDGFVFLAMGFTGKIAAKFKEEYINAFNEMEEMLRKSKETQYAEKLLDEEVMQFNKEMRQYVRRKQMDGRRYFGGAGSSGRDSSTVRTRGISNRSSTTCSTSCAPPMRTASRSWSRCMRAGAGSMPSSGLCRTSSRVSKAT